MAVDPNANAAYFAAHNIPLAVGVNVILEGINYTISSFDNFQVTLTPTGPGSTQSLVIRPMGTGQEIWMDEVLYTVMSVSGDQTTLVLEPVLSFV